MCACVSMTSIFFYASQLRVGRARYSMQESVVTVGQTDEASALFQKFAVVNPRDAAECRHFAADHKCLTPKLFRAATMRDRFFGCGLGSVREFSKESTSRPVGRTRRAVLGRVGNRHLPFDPRIVAESTPAPQEDASDSLAW